VFIACRLGRDILGWLVITWQMDVYYLVINQPDRDVYMNLRHDRDRPFISFTLPSKITCLSA